MFYRIEEYQNEGMRQSTSVIQRHDSFVSLSLSLCLALITLVSLLHPPFVVEKKLSCRRCFDEKDDDSERMHLLVSSLPRQLIVVSLTLVLSEENARENA